MSQDYESYLADRNGELSEQLGRAKAIIENLLLSAQVMESTSDSVYQIAVRSAEKFLKGDASHG